MNLVPEQNEVFLNGNLTKDPELRYTNAGTAMCRLRLAVNRRYKDPKTGDFKDDATFVNVVVWREAAEQCGKRLKKGGAVHVEGRLRSSEYQGKSGEKRHSIEVEARKIQVLEKSESSESIGGGQHADSSADMQEEVTNG